ncbi:vomeronasal type-2 receptor 26-like [Mantella aurantiaca]
MDFDLLCKTYPLMAGERNIQEAAGGVEGEQIHRIDKAEAGRACTAGPQFNIGRDKMYHYDWVIFRPFLGFYRRLLAFIFAVDEINRSPDILPNVTLGYHVYDSCNNVNKAIESILQILSGPGDLIPNFSCLDSDKLAGVIFHPSAERSLYIVQILKLYGYTQFYRGRDKMYHYDWVMFRPFLGFYRRLLAFIFAVDEINRSPDILPNVTLGYHMYDSCNNVNKAIESVLQILSGPGDLIPNFSCLDSDKVVEIAIQLCDSYNNVNKAIESVLQILSGPGDLIPNFSCLDSEKPFLGFYRRLLAFIFAVDEINRSPDILHNVTLGYHMYDSCNNVNKAIESVLQILTGPGDLIPNFSCLDSDKLAGVIFHPSAERSLHIVQILNLYGYTQISWPVSSSIHQWTWIGVIASDDDAGEKQSQELRKVADSYNICIEFNIRIPCDDKHNGHTVLVKEAEGLRNSTSKIISFLRKILFQDPTGEEVFFNERGEMSTSYQINNYVYEMMNRTLLSYIIGRFKAASEGGERLVIYQNTSFWKSGEIPVSVCSSDCPPVHRRVQNPEMPLCCFYCVHCPRGEISNVTDKGSCQKCPEDQWPNDYDQCVPKPVEYLSYTNTPVTLAIFFITVLFFAITLVISLIFFMYRGTPVIRANNRDLSLVLLVSIMLSFLSVFLFLGRPVHITCMLRHTVYGVLFSVAVSSILAKTVIVYMSFKATKPGNAWKKFIGVKIPMCLVLICSFFQIVTSIVWLSVSPPFPEANTDLYLDRIIIQCNEGSILAFAILLGYLGLLAAVSFIVAFLARNLPDGFNEAKYITFSMLVFCSVWITFIPAYLSVTGMNTMLVEIFSIISSSAGILACIFFPKCYIVLVRPDLNSKSIILKQMCHR